MLDAKRHLLWSRDNSWASADHRRASRARHPEQSEREIAAAWQTASRPRAAKATCLDGNMLDRQQRDALGKSLHEAMKRIVLRVMPESWLAEENADRASFTRAPAPEPESLVMMQLDRVYDQLDRLLAHQHASGGNEELEREIERAWARLDELQEKAGLEVRRELDASVELPPDKLEELLRRVERELDDEES